MKVEVEMTAVGWFGHVRREKSFGDGKEEEEDLRGFVEVMKDTKRATRSSRNTTKGDYFKRKFYFIEDGEPVSDILGQIEILVHKL